MKLINRFILFFLIFSYAISVAVSEDGPSDCRGIISPFLNSPLKLLKNHMNSYDLEKGIRYFSSDEQKKHTVLINSDGRLVDYQGNLFSTEDAQIIVEGENTSKDMAIFVLSKEGHLIISNYARSGEIHHSSLVAGNDVWFAGEIKIKKGVILEINNYSGHYRTHERYLPKLINYLKEKNVPLGNYSVRGYEERVTLSFEH